MEHKLWADFIDGKPKAFEAIYNLNVDSLFAYCMKLYADYDLVKDCSQDVFIDLFENKNRITSPNNLKFYLFKVLKCTIFRKIKKERIYGDLVERKSELFKLNYDIETTTIANEINKNKSKLIAECLIKLTNNTKHSVSIKRGTPYSWNVISKSNKTSNTAKSITSKFYNAGSGTESYAPFPSELVTPLLGSEVEGSEISLDWTGSDIDNDIESYDVYFGESKNPDLYSAEIEESILNNVAITSGKTYYWKVITKDKIGNTSESDIFNFTVN